MEQNQTPGGTPAQPSAPQTPAGGASEGAHSVVPMVIAFVALLVAAIAVYFFMAANRAEYAPSPLPAAETALPDPADIPAGTEDPAASALSTQGTSDEVADIGRDLNATDMSALDGIDQI